MGEFYQIKKTSDVDKNNFKLEEISYDGRNGVNKDRTSNTEKAEVMAYTENYHRLLAKGYQEANMLKEANEEIEKGKLVAEKEGKKWEKEDAESNKNAKLFIDESFPEFLRGSEKHLTLNKLKEYYPELFDQTVRKLKKIMIPEGEKDENSEGWDSYKTRFPNIKMSFRTNQDGNFVRFTKG